MEDKEKKNKKANTWNNKEKWGAQSGKQVQTADEIWQASKPVTKITRRTHEQDCVLKCNETEERGWTVQKGAWKMSCREQRMQQRG